MKKIRSLVKRSSILMIIAFFFCSSVIAQERVITGTVTEGAEGLPLIGGTIVIKGTTSGTITGTDGTYQITVRGSEDILVFQFIGLTTQEVPVGDRTVIDINLEVETTALDELVVIGYGTQKKSDLTGSVAVISADDLIKTNAATLDRALQGKAAGVLVTNTSGMPGAGVSIKIRGIGSINRDSEPLYVIDGVPAGNLSTLNPADIASIQILKDASATAIYGARGSNGVIIIETKRGVSGPPKINFSAYAGVAKVTRLFDVMNTDEYIGLLEEAYALDPDRDMPFYYNDSVRASNGNVYTDWQEEMFRPAWNQNYNLSVYGGGENSSYAISGNYYQEDGVRIESQFERINLRANSDFKIGKRLKIGESLTISQTSSNNNGGSWGGAITASPLMPIYDSTAIGGYAGPTDTITVNNTRTNPIAGMMLKDVHNTLTRILVSMYAELELFKGFTYKFTMGLDYKYRRGFNWAPEYELGNIGLRSNVESTLTQSTNDSRYMLIQNIVNYVNSFNGHNIRVMAGHTTERSKT
ncbi:MAG: SusC/RagA family TonB-linked outer membrane protein, partial [Bacteroidales bacterium]|nr:SusC/RagA family TonB-linked outer membrane protein [Bacteroidales bacterium]